MPDEFSPEVEIEAALGRINEIIDHALSPLTDGEDGASDAEYMTAAGEQIAAREIANEIEQELMDLEDWIEDRLGDFVSRRSLDWDRKAHLQFAPRPGWIAEGARSQLDAIESAFRSMRDLCLEYAPHCKENTGLLAAARRVVDSVSNPVEGCKAYIGGHKLQVAERSFECRFERCGQDIGTAREELKSEIVVDMRRELRRLYRDIEVSSVTT